MLDKINLIDLSAISATGCKSDSKYGKSPKCDWNVKGIPTGGIYQFVSVLYTPILKANPANTATVLCADTRSGPTWKKKLYPKYKHGRKHPCNKYVRDCKTSAEFNDVIDWFITECEECKQNESRESIVRTLAHEYAVPFTNNILIKYGQEIGFIIAEQDGLEGDDIIFQTAIDNLDTPIDVYADDRDFSLLTDHHNNLRRISVKGAGYLDTKNPTLLYQIFYGLSKDGIPSLKDDLTQKVRDNIYHDFSENKYPFEYLFSVKSLLKLGLNKSQAESIVRNTLLVIPREAETITLYPTEINKDALLRFLSVFAIKKYADYMKLDLLKGSFIEDERIAILDSLHPALDYYKSIMYNPTNNIFN